MKLKTYPKYKDSGIQWIGELPEEWEVRRCSFYVKPFMGHPFNSKLFDFEGFPLIRIRDLLKQEIETYFSGEYPKEYIIKKGDHLIGMDGDFHNVIWNSKEGLLNQRVMKLTIVKKNQLHTKFFYYLIDELLKIINDLTYSTTVKHLSDEDIRKLTIQVPSYLEQTTIASFLDKKTAQIDELIAKNKKLIELEKEKRVALINHVVTKGLDSNAKMKDSGIEWIGKIPDEAQIMPFRRVCYINQGLQFPEEYRLSEPVEKSRLYITIKYIHAKEEGIKEYIPNPPKGVICKIKDVLLARTGATGEVITNQEGVFHNNFFKINYNSKTHRDYLVYYLSMDSVKKMLLLKSGITTIPDLNHDAFLSTPVILYHLSKQIQIAQYLDRHTALIDKTVKKIEQNIELLEEYRKSLIHHAVTGKVDVRECVA